MEFTLNARDLVSILTPLAIIIGWLANSKASIIILRQSAKAAHKRLDRLEEFLGVSNGRVFQDSKEHEEKEK